MLLCPFKGTEGTTQITVGGAAVSLTTEQHHSHVSEEAIVYRRRRGKVMTALEEGVLELDQDR